MEKYCAVQFEAPPGLAFEGVYLLGFYTHVSEDITQAILEANGLDLATVEPYDVYPAEPYFKVLREILATPGGGMLLISIGQAIGATLVEHHEILSMDDFINSLANGSYNAGVHNAPVDYGLEIERLEANHYRLVNNTPLPNGLIYGLLHETLRILTPASASVQQLTELELENDQGALFEISW